MSTLERDRFKSHPSLSTTNQQMSPIIQSGQWVYSAFSGENVCVTGFVSHPDKIEHKLIKPVIFKHSLLSQFSGNHCHCKQQTHFTNPFILKVYANLHQLQCIQVFQGPPSQPLPQESASLGLSDKLPWGCRCRRARSTV